MSTNSSSADRDPLERLAAEFLDRRRRGENPAPAEYAARCPELAAQILEFFPALEVMEGLKPVADDLTASLANRARAVSALRLEQLGDYRILREIGHGGMGVVYEAIQESLGRRVALKILPLHGRIDPVQMERFQLESRSAARLHHSGIVPVYGVGEHDGVQYYVMQYIQGHGLDVILDDLRRLRAGAAALPPSADGAPKDDTGSIAVARSLLTGRFAQSGSKNDPASVPSIRTENGQASGDAAIPAPGSHSQSDGSGIGSVLSAPTESGYYRAVARLGVQVAEALAHAHGQGVLHRDIKPSNLLLDVDGHVWITDFGLAKVEGSDGPTRTRDVIGTLRYMGPERFDGLSDRRSDIYGLGMTLYELLTFRPAFDAATHIRLIEQVKNDPPPPPRKVDARIPRDLETIVLKAIAKPPSERYATAEALSADLENFMTGRPIMARRSSPVERVWLWCRRNKAAAGLLAATAVAALALVGVIVGAAYNSQLKQVNSSLAQARKDEQTQRELAERNLYYRNILLAGRELQENHVGRVKDLLAQTPAGFRGWEWNYLMRQCRVPLATFILPEIEVYGVALSRDGQLLAASTNVGHVMVWDLATGHIRHKFDLPGAGHGLAFDPSGTELAAGQALPGADSQVVRLWSLRTNRPLRDLRGHTKGIFDVTFSSDGSALASASGDGTVRVWNFRTGQPPLVLQGPCGSYAGVAFSPEGDRLFASSGTMNLDWPASTPYGITVWDVRRPKTPSKQFPHDAVFCGLALSQAGTRLAAGDWKGRVCLWDLERDPDGRNPLILRGHTAMVNRVSFRLDATRLASASDDGSIKIWDVASGDVLFTLRGHHGAAQNVAFHPSGNEVVSVASDGTARLWNARVDPQASALQGHTAAVHSLAFSPDGSRLASVGEDRTLRFWEASTGKSIGEAVALSEKGWSVAYSPDGRQLAVACGDWDPPHTPTPGIVEIHDIASGQRRHRLIGHNRLAWSVAYSPRGDWLASAGGVKQKPGEIILWDPAAGAELGLLPEASEGLYGLSVHPDGSLLAVGSMSGTIRVWDVKRRELIWTRQVFKAWIGMTCFSPSGTNLLGTGEGEVRVKLLNPHDGGEILSVPGPTHQVTSAIFSPDSRRLATATFDGRIQIWDAETGEEVLNLRHAALGALLFLAFSPDGTKLASAGTDGVIRVWDARSVPDSASKSP
jgi:WD40 repeat protein/serine/threonine protein kinase